MTEGDCTGLPDVESCGRFVVILVLIAAAGRNGDGVMRLGIQRRDGDTIRLD